MCFSNDEFIDMSNVSLDADVDESSFTVMSK